MLTNLQSLVQHCLAREWTAIHRCYSHTHTHTELQTNIHSQAKARKQSVWKTKIKNSTCRHEETQWSVFVCVRTQSTYLCIWTSPACLCRTVWICKTEWPQRPRGCVWEASAHGWRAAWSTGEGRKRGRLRVSKEKHITWSGQSAFQDNGQLQNHCNNSRAFCKHTSRILI